MTGDEPLAERSGLFETASAWRMDRRRFLHVAGAATVAAMAGCAGAQSSPPAVAPRGLAAVASPLATSVPDLTTVADLARSLEYDVERIFRFVSDEVRYEPYAGALRGATGTLWARAGNSADQSALLAALLTVSLVPVRFAAGALDASTASAVLSGAQQDAATIRAEASKALFGTGGTASGAGSAGLSSPAPEPTELIARARANQAIVAQAVTTQLQDATGTIVSALSAAGLTIPAITSTMPALEQTRHLWVQYASGPIWVDLDPCLPGNPPAHAIATATETLDQIPDDLRHQVEFVITAESVSGGQLQQAVTLDQSAFADTLVGVPVTFQNAKPSGLKGLGIGISDELTGTVQYVPCLTIGGDSFVVPAPVTFGAGGGVLAEPGQPGSLEGETTAQWLDVRVISPGRDPQVARRTIFDRVGDTARAGGQVDLTALKPVELVDLDADTTREYLPCRVVHSFAVLGGPPSGQYFVQDYSTNDAFSNVSAIGNACHYVREVLFLDRGVPAGARAFSDAPNVISYSIVPTGPGTSPGTDTVAIGLDTWHRSFGQVPVPGVTPTVPPAIVAGVLSHIAERLSTGDGHTLDGSATVSPPVSVGRVFEEAESQGIATRVVRTAADASGAGYPPDVLARLSASLADGSVAIVPERTVAIDGAQRLGWWLVNPLDGRTSDELDDGRGVAATDYSLPLTTTGRAVTAFERLAYCLAKYGFAASLFLGSEANADPSGDLNTVLTIASMMAAAFAEMPGAALC